MAATSNTWKVYIVEPEAATNLCTNPSAETAIAGYYAGNNCTVTQSAEQARYGKYSVKGVPTNVNTLANIYTTIPVSNGVKYYFRAWVKGEAGKTYTLRIQTSGGSDLATTTFTANGYWQFKEVSGTAATTSYNFMVSRDANQNTTAAFYVDGWCVDTVGGTYFDGDTTDPYLDYPVYGWNGTPHASTSTRSASTRSGGTLLDISGYATLRFIQGLGLTSYNTNASDLSLGGALYQNSHANPRDFSLICSVSISPTAAYGTFQAKLKRLQRAVNPKRMKTDQPLRLVFQGFDANGIEATDRITVDCVYTGGLEGDLSGRVQNIAVNFRQHNPEIKSDGYAVTSLSPSTTVDGKTVASLLFVSQDTGTTTAVTDFSDIPLGTIQDKKGGLYIYGSFANYGDASGDGIVYRNSAGVISSMGSGAVSPVYTAVIGLDGKLYVGGTSDNIGGNANADRIASWDGSTWGALAGGLNDNVKSICIDNAGNLYAGGQFTQAKTGTVTLNYVGKWNGSAWSALGAGTVGVNADVMALCSLPDNRIVIGGNFTAAGGSASYQYLTIYNPATNTFSALGANPNNAVYVLRYDQKRGYLYAFGTFTQIGGVTANYCAFWDGNNWNPMPGKGESTTMASLGQNGEVYCYGTFTIRGNTYQKSIAEWIGPGSGGEWRIIEYASDANLYAVNYRPDTNEQILLGYNNTGTLTYTVPAVSTITNSTEGNLYPWLCLDNTGQYVYSLWNRTTGDRIYLNGLTVGAGEKIWLQFNANGYTITSNIRGDLRSAVGTGSSPTFKLQPGANYVSCFVYPSPTAAITIPLYYPTGGYISLDEAVYE